MAKYYASSFNLEYEGTIENGLQKGTGQISIKNIEDGSSHMLTYSGSLVNNFPNGKGTLVIITGKPELKITYTGEFQEGLPHPESVFHIKTEFNGKTEEFTSKLTIKGSQAEISDANTLLNFYLSGKLLISDNDKLTNGGKRRKVRRSQKKYNRRISIVALK
jgi:hypothetical protein